MISAKTIFVVDDDADDLEIFGQALEAVAPGTPLVMIADSSTLLPILHADNTALPGLLFLDLNMPLKPGMECLAEINADPILNHLKIVVLSTSVNPDNISEAYKLGASFYAVKPNDFNALSRLISKILYHDWDRARECNEFLLDYNPPGFKQVIWFK